MAYYWHCSAALASAGRHIVSCEAVPHRTWCSVAQPHSCTKESHTDTAIRLKVDGLAMGSSASKKSRSLELLLTLHTVVGCHWVRRTTGGSRPARARCAIRPPIDAVQAHMVWRCTAEGDGLSSLRTDAGVAAPAHV